MTLTPTESILSILVMAVVTFLTRLLPFLFFGGNREVPKIITYLGKVLPPAVMAILIVFCLRNIDFLTGTHGFPELVSVLAVVLLHLWKRNNLLSIFGGTILYMVLVQNGIGSF